MNRERLTFIDVVLCCLFHFCPRSSLQFDKGKGQRSIRKAAKDRTLDFLAGHRRKTAIPDSESEVVVDGGCEGDLTGDAVHSCEKHDGVIVIASFLMTHFLSLDRIWSVSVSRAYWSTLLRILVCWMIGMHFGND